MSKSNKKQSTSVDKTQLSIESLESRQLMAANTLTSVEIDMMLNYVEDQLDGNAAHYQFAPAQDGEILLEHSYTDPEVIDAPLDSNTPLNIGSVSKLITAVTVLKLVDTGEIDLNTPFVEYLDPTRFDIEAIHDDWRDVTVMNLLTHTSGFSGEDQTRPSAGNTEYKGLPLLADASNHDDCDSSGCAKNYENNNYGVLRLVIEGVRRELTEFRASPNVVVEEAGNRMRFTTVEDLVHTVAFENFVKDLWLLDAANPSSSNGPTCHATPNVDYFSRDSEGDIKNVTDSDSPFLGENRFSISCSSGGWKVSSNDMIEVMGALRNGSVLSEDMTNLLFSTDLKDKNGKRVGVGFEPAYKTTVGTTTFNSGKNGKTGGASAYVTQLPNGVDAVLMTNTAVSGGTSVTSLVKKAFKSLENLPSVALATGDFDGDGLDDVARGMPYYDVDEIQNAGAVDIVYGNEFVINDYHQRWSQDSSGIKGRAEKNDRFGSSLATGDFNADGYDDLAIGVPGEAIGSRLEAGAVNVLFGSPNGLTASEDELIHQNSPGIEGATPL